MIKQYIWMGFVIVLSLILVGCGSMQNSYLSNDYTRESWQSLIQTNPAPWKKGADRWFLTGEPNDTEINNRQSAASAMSTMTVRVTNFTNIKVDGPFQVQIIGTNEDNSVWVNGPNAGVRSIAIAVHGDTLSVRQVSDMPASVMRRVIVRIGIRQLHQLTQLGSGTVEAIRIQSDALTIQSAGSGNIYLVGNINLKCVGSTGAGSVNVFGAYTPDLIIRSDGSGDINICGNVGVREISHHGRGDINIIGANSNNLSIYTECVGKIGIYGVVNLRRVTATGETCVYICNVKSPHLMAHVAGSARVGLSGMARDLYVNTANVSSFLGRDLCVDSAYASAHQQSHINLNANRKAFASATDGSSIYFFGPSHLLTSFTSGNGIVMPINVRNWCNYGSEYRPYSYTYSQYRTGGRSHERVNYKNE